MNQKHLFLLFYSHIPLMVIILYVSKSQQIFELESPLVDGALAQLIERGIRIAEVAGLIPARSTIFYCLCARILTICLFFIVLYGLENKHSSEKMFL